jgi:hypothetical protein
MSAAVNALSPEPDVNDAAHLSIAQGSTPEALVIRMSGGGGRRAPTMPSPGRLGPLPRMLVFTDPLENQRFQCHPSFDGVEHSMLCDNGEPQGIGSQMNPKHRSFYADRLCGPPGKLRVCAAGDRDAAPPL